MTEVTIRWKYQFFVHFGQFLSILVISKLSKAHIFVTFGFWSQILFFWTTKLLLFHQKHFGGKKVKILDVMKNLSGRKKTPLFSPHPPQEMKFPISLGLLWNASPSHFKINWTILPWKVLKKFFLSLSKIVQKYINIIFRT